MQIVHRSACLSSLLQLHRDRFIILNVNVETCTRNIDPVKELASTNLVSHLSAPGPMKSTPRERKSMLNRHVVFLESKDRVRGRDGGSGGVDSLENVIEMEGDEKSYDVCWWKTAILSLESRQKVICCGLAVG
ncbi:hypothetical protein Tco_0002797 [Tanacetum coccineum]